MPEEQQTTEELDIKSDAGERVIYHDHDGVNSPKLKYGNILGTPTIAEIVDDLEELTGGDRLNATAIRNLDTVLLTPGETLSAGNAVGFGNYNGAKDYQKTQSDADTSFHDWVDLYVDADDANTNFLTVSSGRVGFQSSGGAHEKYMFLYIDLDDIPDYFTNVKLKIYDASITNGTDVGIDVRRLTSQWNTVAPTAGMDRSEVTWNNKPTADGVTWASITLTGAGTYVELDITNLILYLKAGLATNYGFALIPNGVNATIATNPTYASIHTINGANAPKVTVDGLEDVGKVFKTDNTVPISIYNFAGFATAAAVADVETPIQRDGLISIAGLSANKDHYISGTAGQVAKASTAVNSFGALLKVGRARSDGASLVIERGQKIQTGTITLSTNNSYGNIKTYFRPTKIEFFLDKAGIHSRGVAYEVSKMIYQTGDGASSNEGTDHVYNDGTDAIDVIAIGECATLLRKTAGNNSETLRWIAYD